MSNSINSILTVALTAGGGGGAECPSDTSHREISADLPGKERQGEKGNWGWKEGKLKKGRWKLENGRRKSYKMRTWGEDFFFFFFSFSLFKTTEICFRSTKMGIFYREKIHFPPWKKIKKNYFAPSEKYSSYAPVWKIWYKNSTEGEWFETD